VDGRDRNKIRLQQQLAPVIIITSARSTGTPGRYSDTPMANNATGTAALPSKRTRVSSADGSTTPRPEPMAPSMTAQIIGFFATRRKAPNAIAATDTPPAPAPPSASTSGSTTKQIGHASGDDDGQRLAAQERRNQRQAHIAPVGPCHRQGWIGATCNALPGGEAVGEGENHAGD
jgi:hypothetical protein